MLTEGSCMAVWEAIKQETKTTLIGHQLTQSIKRNNTCVIQNFMYT